MLNTIHIFLISQGVFPIFNTNDEFQLINMYYKQMFYVLKTLTISELSAKGTPYFPPVPPKSTT